MDNEKKETSGIKTHKEIMTLFNDIETLEEKIRNPNSLIEESIQTKVSLQEVQQPPQTQTVIRVQQQDLQPAGEIQWKKKPRHNQIQFRKPELDDELARQPHTRSSFLKKKKTLESEPEVPGEVELQLPEVKPIRTTFTLDIDSNGNLVGFPMKKQKPQKGKNIENNPENQVEEPAKGIKGKLLQLASRFRRKKTAEGETEGIASKIKGIFRRKSKE